MMKFSEVFLARFTALGLVVAVFAGQWDVWWHVGIGRETFWEPPHMLLYGALGSAICAGVYGWYCFRHSEWKKIGMVLAIVPLLAPFDELWHQWFGVENLSSPLVIWAAPHVLLTLAGFAALGFVLPLLRNDPDQGLRRLGLLGVYAAMLTLLMILTFPFDPIGPYHVWGGAGVFPIAFVITFMFLLAKEKLAERGSTLLLALCVLAFYLISVEDREAPQIIIPIHDHFPPWVTAFSYLLPALVLESLTRVRSLVHHGAIFGGLWALIAYGISPYFFKALPFYGYEHTLLFVVFALFGGAAGGALVKKYIHDTES